MSAFVPSNSFCTLTTSHMGQSSPQAFDSTRRYTRYDMLHIHRHMVISCKMISPVLCCETASTCNDCYYYCCAIWHVLFVTVSMSFSPLIKYGICILGCHPDRRNRHRPQAACQGQHHYQHTRKVGRVVTALEAAQERPKHQPFHCGRASPCGG